MRVRLVRKHRARLTQKEPDGSVRTYVDTALGWLRVPRWWPRDDDPWTYIGVALLALILLGLWATFR